MPLASITSQSLSPVAATGSFAEFISREWEVIVVGAGPAGSLAARQLALAGAKVLLIDRNHFPRRKVCGCCLNAVGLQVLEEVGLKHLADRPSLPTTQQMYLATRSHRATLSLIPQGKVISREELDTTLVREAIAAGVDFFPGRQARLEPAMSSTSEAPFREVWFRGETQPLRAKLILAADGLGGSLLKPLENQEPPVSTLEVAVPSRLGVGGMAESVPEFYQPDTIYMAYGDAGYLGLVRLADGRLDMAAAMNAEAVKQQKGWGNALASILGEVSFPLPDDWETIPWQGTPKLTCSRERLFAERVLVLGDAAGYVEPFTGEGMSWAMLSAYAIVPFALQAMHQGTEFAGPAWDRQYQEIIGKRMRACRWIRTLGQYPFLARRAIQLGAWFPSWTEPVMRLLHQSPKPLFEMRRASKDL
ncbi:Flavin-dependent dehydrogenase [Planctomycetales bacterium 10988]|nr:Flavin-dependent dehydrogenase [Planctomycetales bacterium 10988]